MIEGIDLQNSIELKRSGRSHEGERFDGATRRIRLEYHCIFIKSNIQIHLVFIIALNCFANLFHPAKHSEMFKTVLRCELSLMIIARINGQRAF